MPLVLTTAGGTWKGVGTGVGYLHETTLHTVGSTVHEGEGAYTWPTYTQTWARELRFPGPKAPYLVSGWLEPKKGGGPGSAPGAPLGSRD